MFSGNKAMIEYECDKCNEVRRVWSGSVDYHTFFRQVKGDLLISGYLAENTTLLTDMICAYAQRADIPTIVFSGHADLFENLRQKQSAEESFPIIIADPWERSYDPFGGLSAQPFLRLIRMTAEGLGYSVLTDQILQYASAIVNIVTASYPLSLPAVTKLLQYDDDFISAHALQKGLSNVIADNIRANHEAGIAFRRICEKLESVFEEVYSSETEGGCSFQTGVENRKAVMAFYSAAADQYLLNSYLKEELFFALKKVPRIRIILDEMPFENGEDELLTFLMEMKRQRKVELIFVSTNAWEAAYGTPLTFSNVILCEHADPMSAENLSKALWGTYHYHYPVPVVGKPPAVFFTFETTVQWQIATEDRLRVRAEDLYAKQGFFMHQSDLLAVKTNANSNIYLIPSSEFLSTSRSLFAIPKRA